MEIRSLRQGRGWTQEELAEKAGLSVRTIQRIEQKGQGRLASYQILAEIFGIQEHEVLGERLPCPLFNPLLAQRIGMLLLLPAILFVVTNIIRYPLGHDEFPNLFGPLFEVAWIEAISPLVFVGGCAAALILNIVASVGVSLDRRMVLYFNGLNLSLVIIAAILATALAGYALLENLSHWIEGQ